MEYTVAYAFDLNKLIDKVNKLIKEGYKPIGGIAIISNTNGLVYNQPMIKG